MLEDDVIVFTDVVRVRHPSGLVRWYLENVAQGPAYYEPRELETDCDQLVFGDLAWAVLLAGQPRGSAAASLLNVVPFDISGIPKKALQDLDYVELESTALVISDLIKSTTGVKSSIATKMLHPKRRATVPVCDNQAIFGSFLQPGWRPGDKTSQRKDTVLAAIEAVHRCLTREENQSAWISLRHAYPRYERVEVFDMVWWTVLRNGAQLVESDGCYELPQAL